MCRCLGNACAGVLMLALSGCLDSFLSPQIMVNGPREVVAGSVAEVSAKLENGLSEAGVFLRTKRVGDDYRIASQWKKRTVFCLHLSEKKIDGSVKTLVRMQWDRGGDNELWQLIQAILSTPSNDSTSASKAPAADEK
ncbi:MAG TPA: hypothetical protein VMG10_15320 [Gemmataceae bacterium]|nr:hypothetical protein [Gemmataceae bacterium]